MSESTESGARTTAASWASPPHFHPEGLLQHQTRYCRRRLRFSATSRTSCHSRDGVDPHLQCAPGAVRGTVEVVGSSGRCSKRRSSGHTFRRISDGWTGLSSRSDSSESGAAGRRWWPQSWARRYSAPVQEWDSAPWGRYEALAYEEVMPDALCHRCGEWGHVTPHCQSRSPRCSICAGEYTTMKQPMPS